MLTLEKVYLDADFQYGFYTIEAKSYGYVYHGDGSAATVESAIPPYKIIQPSGHELENQYERQQIHVWPLNADKTKHVIQLSTGSVSSGILFRPGLSID